MLDVRRSDLTLGIVGAGVMGRGIAQIAAAAGIAVRLVDARPDVAVAARDEIGGTLAKLVGKGRMTPDAAHATTERIVAVADERALAGCHIVIEAIIEDLAAKRALFAALEPIVGDECLLATNTSSLSVTAIAAACKRPGRVAGFHFFNPVPLMKIVEVIPGLLTEPDVVEALTALAQRMGHKPVRAADTPGFIVNHAGRGFGTEALRVLQEAVAPFEEIDRILRETAGFRMGPFELMDLTGLDVSHPVMESIYAQFYHEPRFRPSYLLRQRVDAGLLGRKTGRGFYGYHEGKQLLPPAVTASTPKLPREARPPVWIGAASEDWDDMLGELADAAGWTRDTAETPGATSLCLVAPLGADATSTALSLGLDARRTVAVDLLFGLDRRRCLMTTPVTRPEFVYAAHALLAADGTAVSRLHDSPGFVAQRVVATIVNIACEMAQQRIAAPADIDDAVTLGLGYPAGPLAMGNALGPMRILRVLEGIQTVTGDPRYRPSPWLARRARLGVSLLTEEG